MKLKLIYPKWGKLARQTEFHLPPHGPVCMAAAIPPEYEVSFIDENVDRLDLDRDTNVVLLSMMLTCQIPRGLEIAAAYREHVRRENSDLLDMAQHIFGSDELKKIGQAMAERRGVKHPF